MKYLCLAQKRICPDPLPFWQCEGHCNRKGEHFFYQFQIFGAEKFYAITPATLSILTMQAPFDCHDLTPKLSEQFQSHWRNMFTNNFC
jgi:hypothetical protein